MKQGGFFLPGRYPPAGEGARQPSPPSLGAAFCFLDNGKERIVARGAPDLADHSLARKRLNRVAPATRAWMGADFMHHEKRRGIAAPPLFDSGWWAVSAAHLR